MQTERLDVVCDLAARLGHSWNDISILETALRHSSYAHQAGCSPNERLEYLGDSVLDLLSAEYLMARHPDQREGFLSQQRAELVRMCALAARARALGIGEALLVGKGGDYLRTTESVLADALEAVVGAAYVDGGLPAARQVVHNAGIF